MYMKKKNIIWLRKYPCSYIKDMKSVQYEYVKSLIQDKEQAWG